MYNNKEPNNQIIVTNEPRKQFIENIQKWVLIESQIKKINEKLKEMRDMKYKLSESVCDYIQENNLEDTKIEITNGEIRLFEKKEYSPLTFSYIEKCLGEIISEKSHVNHIINYLKENRVIQSSMDLRRINYDKSK